MKLAGASYDGAYCSKVNDVARFVIDQEDVVVAELLEVVADDRVDHRVQATVVGLVVRGV